MKPLCCSSEPVEGVIEKGKPSSFMARESAALVGSFPRKKTWVSIDMALAPDAVVNQQHMKQRGDGLVEKSTWRDGIRLRMPPRRATDRPPSSAETSRCAATAR